MNRRDYIKSSASSFPIIFLSGCSIFENKDSYTVSAYSKGPIEYNVTVENNRLKSKSKPFRIRVNLINNTDSKITYKNSIGAQFLISLDENNEYYLLSPSFYNDKQIHFNGDCWSTVGTSIFAKNDTKNRTLKPHENIRFSTDLISRKSCSYPEKIKFLEKYYIGDSEYNSILKFK